MNAKNSNRNREREREDEMTEIKLENECDLAEAI